MNNAKALDAAKTNVIPPDLLANDLIWASAIVIRGDESLIQAVRKGEVSLQTGAILASLEGHLSGNYTRFSDILGGKANGKQVRYYGTVVTIHCGGETITLTKPGLEPAIFQLRKDV